MIDMYPSGPPATRARREAAPAAAVGDDWLDRFHARGARRRLRLRKACQFLRDLARLGGGLTFERLELLTPEFRFSTAVLEVRTLAIGLASVS